jgi:hypothetical protein
LIAHDYLPCVQGRGQRGLLVFGLIISPPNLSRRVSALLGIRQGVGRVIKVKKMLYLHTVKVEVKVETGARVLELSGSKIVSMTAFEVAN